MDSIAIEFFVTTCSLLIGSCEHVATKNVGFVEILDKINLYLNNIIKIFDRNVYM